MSSVELQTPLGRKGDALHKTRERHLAELDRLRVRVVELVRLEEQTRDASVNVAPGRRSDEKGALSQVAKVIADRRKAEAEIVSLEREIESVNRVALKAAAERAKELRADATRRALTSQAQERAALEAFCGCFVALTDAWQALRLVQEARYAHTGSVRTGSLLNDAGPDESAAWDQAAAPVGAKVPQSFLKAVELAFIAATDDGARIPSAQGGSPTAGSWWEFVPPMLELAHARTVVADPFVETIGG